MNINKTIKIGNAVFDNDKSFSLIAGPCAMESEQHSFDMAGKIKEICQKNEVGFVYKSSFDKANRTSINSDRGIGIEKAIEIFGKLKEQLEVPVITDVHSVEQINQIAPCVDILQIPAFLCRQTDLLVAAAKSGKIVNVKKGQFLAPWDMGNVVEKIAESGNPNVMVTERGTSFGYNTLVSDFRSLQIMSELNVPVIFDATHSVQKPGGQGSSSGGDRQYVRLLARAAVAVGVAGVFVETHQDPDKAPSDGPNMINVDNLGEMINEMKEIDNIIKK